MKKILVDCYFFENEFQGSRTYISNLYNKIFELEKSKPESQRKIYYLTTYLPEKLKSEFNEYDFVKIVKHKFKNRYLRLLIEFPLIILKYKIDIAHFQYKAPPIKLCKYILTIHDVLFIDNVKYTGVKYFLINYLSIRFSFSISDLVLTVSEYSKKQMINKFSKNKKIEIIENAVDEEFFSFEPLIQKSNFLLNNNLREYFIYLSRFEPRKNHYNLLSAYVEGEFYKNYDLVLIGHESLKCKKFDELYNSLDETLKARILLNKTGISQLDLFHFIKFSKAFIYPSLFEGFGIPPLEAAALKVNVICSNLTAMKYFDFFNPFHIYPSVKNLKKSLNEVIKKNDDKRLTSIRNMVKKKYNWYNSAKKLYNFFNSI